MNKKGRINELNEQIAVELFHNNLSKVESLKKMIKTIQNMPDDNSKEKNNVYKNNSNV